MCICIVQSWFFKVVLKISKLCQRSDICRVYIHANYFHVSHSWKWQVFQDLRQVIADLLYTFSQLDGEELINPLNWVQFNLNHISSASGNVMCDSIKSLSGKAISHLLPVPYPLLQLVCQRRKWDWPDWFLLGKPKLAVSYHIISPKAKIKNWLFRNFILLSFQLLKVEDCFSLLFDLFFHF